MADKETKTERPRGSLSESPVPGEQDPLEGTLPSELLRRLHLIEDAELRGSVLDEALRALRSTGAVRYLALLGRGTTHEKRLYPTYPQGFPNSHLFSEPDVFSEPEIFPTLVTQGSYRVPRITSVDLEKTVRTEDEDDEAQVLWSAASDMWKSVGERAEGLTTAAQRLIERLEGKERHGVG